MADKITLSKKDRMDVCWRHQFLQGSWNYERMQNGGWCYSIIPAIKKLYKTEEDRAAALKRHLEFYNTHPYVSAPVMGVTLALEEERANGMPVDDQTVQGVKVGMMGPLAGVGDPVFWFTVRLLGKVTEGASILGMFIIGALVQRWVSISFTPVVSQVTQSKGAYIEWDKLPKGAAGIKEALSQYASLGANGLNQTKVTTLQQNLDQLIPGLAALLLTLLCCYLLKKKVSPIVIIIALFIVGIVARVIGIM